MTRKTTKIQVSYFRLIAEVAIEAVNR